MVIDDFTRECLAIEVDGVFSSRRVIRILEDIAFERGGLPQTLRFDNVLPELSRRHRGGRKLAAATAVDERLPGSSERLPPVRWMRCSP
jgi:transposase InsO family protein